MAGARHAAAEFIFSFCSPYDSKMGEMKPSGLREANQDDGPR
jgi:hypothetical protein